MNKRRCSIKACCHISANYVWLLASLTPSRMNKTVAAAVFALTRHVKYDDIHNKRALWMEN